MTPTLSQRCPLCPPGRSAPRTAPRPVSREEPPPRYSAVTWRGGCWGCRRRPYIARSGRAARVAGAAGGAAAAVSGPPPPSPGPGAAAMRLRMISAASVLVLLFLPSESCSPLQPRWEPTAARPPHGLCRPRGAAPGPDPPRASRALQAGKRREGKPNSLDLTFHLLREFLEMSREERLAQKALSNKLLLQSIGK
eukprot:XP_024998126.1 corticoliberin isoform X3 [Gallus gallus]